MKKIKLIIVATVLSFSLSAQNGLTTFSNKNVLTTNYGSITFGPQNASWAHIYSDMPKFIFNKDVYTTTGGFSSHYVDLSLKTAGTTRMTIDYSTGGVGIGTTNPARPLHVSGHHAGVLLRFERTGSSTGLCDLGSTDGDFRIWPGGYENSSNNVFIVKNVSGNVGIGEVNPDSKLSVNGKIHAKEVLIDLLGWSDFVFYDDYKLPSLREVELFINENGHLNGIPSAATVLEKGVNMGDMSSKLLQKIEELTLYTIDQEKKITDLESQISAINEKLNK